MAQFHVGQRVKKVRQHAESRPDLPGVPVGAEGTVTWLEVGSMVHVLYDEFPSVSSSGEWRVETYMLAPLTDPKADEFIESIKRLKPYDEPVRGNRLVTLDEMLRGSK